MAWHGRVGWLVRTQFDDSSESSIFSPVRRRHSSFFLPTDIIYSLTHGKTKLVYRGQTKAQLFPFRVTKAK